MSAVTLDSREPVEPNEAVDSNESVVALATAADSTAEKEQLAKDQLVLSAQLTEARDQLASLSEELRALDGRIDALTPERKQHELLLDICDRLQQLGASGGGPLFWEGSLDVDASAEHIQRARIRIDAFNAGLAEIEDARSVVIDNIKQQQNFADLIEDDLFEALEEEERRNQEWIIEREIGSLPAYQAFMPWTRGGEADRRFRKVVSSALLVCLLIAIIFPMINLPLRSRDAATDIPDRVVQLLMKQPKPIAPLPPKEIKKKEAKAAEEKLAKEIPQSKPDKQTETPAPEQQKPQGLLAFREQFSKLKEDEVLDRLGSQAAINDSGNSAGRPERAMLTSNAPGSSGGINLSSLSRNVGGGGGGMGKVQVSRASSAIGGIGRPGQDRPMSGDSVARSRTDEEIQIVFDRYKSSLYRLYNRELRKDPTLRGQMLLKLTIEADGSVSMCLLQNSDMNAPDLSAQVVDRVKTINFGAKEGIPAITILYPIDFLPAA
jgi:hypothetical protein